jgi:hypothetical protein
MPSYTRFSRLWLSALPLLAACADAATGPPQIAETTIVHEIPQWTGEIGRRPSLSSILIEGTTVIDSGMVVAWAATPITRKGTRIDAAVHWTSASPEIASVTTGPLGLGLISGRAPGSTLITATAGEISRSVVLRVD